MGRKRLVKVLEPLVAKGLTAVLVFGVLNDLKGLKLKKDNKGTIASDERSPVVMVSLLKQYSIIIVYN